MLETVALSVSLLVAAFVALWALVTSFRYIPNNQIGIVEKLASRRGSVRGGFIALSDEAGFQPAVLRGGWHVLFPLVYRIHRVPLVTIPQGKIGYVFARDGASLAPSQALGSAPAIDGFEDARSFLVGGGQKGPQRRVLREGTYAINLALFVVVTEGRVHSLSLSREEASLLARMVETIEARGGFRPIVLTEDLVGVVTIHDGPSLAAGEIIAPIVGDDVVSPDYHNKFQDPERFLAAGGRRGRQLEVLVEGTYYLNRLFATVETIPKSVIEVGTVGVVVSYTGTKTSDLSGSDYTHGETVSAGSRGVWSAPLMPGKYAFNTYGGKIVAVPTTNIILKWIHNQAGAHHYDENLTEVSLITRDAFEPSLPLSVVLHIDYREAPLVIQRFGDIQRLVEQTLDPMVAAYFKNIGQTKTLIELIQERSEIQQIASKEMKTKFAQYNLELVETLIGTPSSSGGDHRIEEILDQLRTRQIAREQVETFERQEVAAVKERELREAEARARQQQTLTESEIDVAIQSNQGKAEYQRSLQQAAQIRALAEAEAAKIRALAEAEADRAAKVGVAEAVAMEEQVHAYGGPQFQVVQNVMNRLAEAIERSGADIVPKIVLGADGGKAGIVESILALLLSEKVGLTPLADRDPAVTAYRERVRSKALA